MLSYLYRSCLLSPLSTVSNSPISWNYFVIYIFFCYTTWPEILRYELRTDRRKNATLRVWGRKSKDKFYRTVSLWESNLMRLRVKKHCFPTIYESMNSSKIFAKNFSWITVVYLLNIFRQYRRNNLSTQSNLQLWLDLKLQSEKVRKGAEKHI